MNAMVQIRLLAGVWGAVCVGALHAATNATELLPAANIAPATLEAMAVRLKSLHHVISKPGPSDWLAQHREPGQTFRQYVRCDPVVPQGRRRVIYVQPVGAFTNRQQDVLALSADFMGRYFNLPVVIKDPLALSAIPASARRKHPQWGMEQILSTYVLDDVLKPALPEDAVVLLAMTTSDLWPGEGWNFVFGQASLRERVGVWSIYRNGDPAKSDEAFKLCLMRTMKTAVHETGHMFSMLHCTAWECCMCGSNHMEESDRRPVWLCPECVAKVCWATRTEPAARYRRLAEFCEKQEFRSEAEFYRKSRTALGKTP
jgi:archaemetzincin